MRLRQGTASQERSGFSTAAAGGERGGAKSIAILPAFECTSCHRAYREPEPRLFSFNNPFGACPRCEGFGNTIDFDPGLIIPDRSKTLDDGAIHPWTSTKYRAHQGEMKRFAKAAGIPTNVPWYDLTAVRSRGLSRTGMGVTPGFADSLRSSTARSTSCM